MDSDDNKTLLNKQSLPSSTPHTPTPASQSHPSPTPHTPASQSHPPPTPHTSTPPKKSRTYEDYSSDDQRSNLRTIQQRFEMSQKNKGKARIREGSLSPTRHSPTRRSPSRRSPSPPRRLPSRISNPFLVDDLQITTHQTREGIKSLIIVMYNKLRLISCQFRTASS